MTAPRIRALLTFDAAVSALRAWDYNEREHRARCPAHGGKDRNQSVRADENGIAGFKCWSRGCGTKEIVAALGVAPAPAKFAPARVRTKAAETQTNSERALTIWREARDTRSTIVQDYLFGRGFRGEMPAPFCVGADPAELARAGIGLAVPASIRFHPRLWHAPRVYLPAMVAAIKVPEGRFVGVHRTWLKPDGTGKAEVKPNKKALGRERGCAVHLTAGAPEVVLCEGIETGLSILQATGLHVWAALGTSNLGQVELPGYVRESSSRPTTMNPG